MADSSGVNLTDLDQSTTEPTSILHIYTTRSDDTDDKDFTGHGLAIRISAPLIFLIVTTLATLFPVAAKRTRLRIPLYVYLFAWCFGTGVIIATAFVHLLDEAWKDIGPRSHIAQNSRIWSEYPWPAAIALASAMGIFLLDFLADWLVSRRYHYDAHQVNVEEAVCAGDQRHEVGSKEIAQNDGAFRHTAHDASSLDEQETEIAFRERIPAFIILEFGVIFHSIFIGLDLGVLAGNKFNILLAVIVVHETFEGLGLGARLSDIPIPRRWRWLPWVLGFAYGLTMPIAIAVGLVFRSTYDRETEKAHIVSGVFNSISTGILLYSGLVEMLARDFIFDHDRTQDTKRITFSLVSLFLGVMVMSILAYWA
ncbi:hypothetical protein LQW54_012186 [Pestalotiopsis sp. IQ-011]